MALTSDLGEYLIVQGAEPGYRLVSVRNGVIGDELTASVFIEVFAGIHREIHGRHYAVGFSRGWAWFML